MQLRNFEYPQGLFAPEDPDCFVTSVSYLGDDTIALDVSFGLYWYKFFTSWEPLDTRPMEPLDDLLSTPSKHHWERVGLKRRAGIVVPLFSLYSSKSVGIGEFDDLKLLVDWCVKTGNSIIQLLPMNELGPLFCPYDSTSSFALEPAFLELKHVQSLSGCRPANKIEDLREKYPTSQEHVNYAIKDAKLEYLWEMFQQSQGRKDKRFKEFVAKNSYWLGDFTLFKTLKFYHREHAWYEWDDPYRNRNPRALEEFGRKHAEVILFHTWVQWLLFEQLVAAKKYAESKGVLLKGDLPVLVSLDSADVWAHQTFFNLDLAAGAPPDMYCAKGQRWGMPTYRWQNIAQDGYRYLREKLRYASNFYDILRVDHVVGLFRIWSIPSNEPVENQGLNGFFDPTDEELWEEHGKRILAAMLDSSGMLLCAEDLGTVPPICRKVLAEYGIPGNDVQRWTKDWDVRHDFLDPHEYRALSVSMLSTHDSTNWPAWWENEAGTADGDLFRRKCIEHGIDFNRAKRELFDDKRSRHGRLRWKETISSPEVLTAILQKPPDKIWDILHLYKNSFREKENLWKHLGFSGEIQEKSNREMIRRSLEMTLNARSVYCVNLLMDWLFLTDKLEGDPYPYRINTPGVTGTRNWSLVLPLSLEDLLASDLCNKMREIIESSDRI